MSYWCLTGEQQAVGPLKAMRMSMMLVSVWCLPVSERDHYQRSMLSWSMKVWLHRLGPQDVCIGWCFRSSCKVGVVTSHLQFHWMWRSGRKVKPRLMLILGSGK